MVCVKFPLEVAVFSGTNALKAQQFGASRVEINAPGSYVNGGLTPPIQELTQITAMLRIPIRIMIRPVGAPLERDVDGFMYTASQFAQMEESVAEFKLSGAMNLARGDGFVFGIIRLVHEHNSSSTPQAKYAIDKQRCSVLVELAKPYPCVFHRAFDPIAQLNPGQGLQDLVDCKFEGLLTSGGPGSHAEHIETLDYMISHIKGGLCSNLQIIVGGGIRSTNVAEVATKLGIHESSTVWVHSACLTFKPEHPPEDIDIQELQDLCAVLLED